MESIKKQRAYHVQMKAVLDEYYTFHPEGSWKEKNTFDCLNTSSQHSTMIEMNTLEHLVLIIKQNKAANASHVIVEYLITNVTILYLKSSVSNILSNLLGGAYHDDCNNVFQPTSENSLEKCIESISILLGKYFQEKNIRYTQEVKREIANLLKELFKFGNFNNEKIWRQYLTESTLSKIISANNHPNQKGIKTLVGQIKPYARANVSNEENRPEDKIAKFIVDYGVCVKDEDKFEFIANLFHAILHEMMIEERLIKPKNYEAVRTFIIEATNFYLKSVKLYTF